MREYSQKEIAEELLILEKAKKNPRHFSWLYEKHYKQIYLFIYRRAGDQELTSDICSQVFLKALNNLHKYEYRGLPFVAWLFRIAGNEVKMHFRKHKNIRSVSLEDAGIFRLTEELEECNKELMTSIIIEAIQELSEDEITILELRYFENHSVREVSYILNESESNIKVKTHRIIKKLKLVVGERYKDE